jgi:thioredoxin-like negative regulator of GroEL
VVEIDAAAQPDQAGHWGVLSVPTTILIDPAGKPRHINHGVAPAEKLRRQITELFQE